LLDAGPDFTEEADTPPDLLDSRNLAGLEHDWGYTASPFQDAAFPIAEGKSSAGPPQSTQQWRSGGGRKTLPNGRALVIRRGGGSRSSPTSVVSKLILTRPECTTGGMAPFRSLDTPIQSYSRSSERFTGRAVLSVSLIPAITMARGTAASVPGP
jgi:hypothetical protein